MFSYQWVANDGGTDTDISGETDATYTLVADDEGKTIKVKVTFTDDASNQESLASAATDAVAPAPQPDSPATGQPTISGTVQVGETLTADTSAIADDDGLVNATYTYQWVAGESDIGGATGSSYTLEADDEGKTIKVRVTVTDDAGNETTLSSGATDTVEAPQPPAKPTGLSAAVSHDAVTLAWDNPQDDSITGYVILRRDREIHPVGTFVTITDDTGSADTTYTDDTVEPDKQYVYRIKAINEHGKVSEISDWVRGFTPAVPVPGGLAGELTGGAGPLERLAVFWATKKASTDVWTGEAGVSNPESERSRPGANRKGDACARIGESRWLRSGRNSCAMPRQRTHHSRRIYDFPQRHVRFKEESDLPWAELNRRLGTDPHMVRRWRDEGVRPSVRHFAALLNLAGSLGLGHLFTE